MDNGNAQITPNPVLQVNSDIIDRNTITSASVDALTGNATGQAQFVRGINLNGDAVTIGGNRWLSQNDALNSGLSIQSSTTAINYAQPLTPAVDADTSNMLTSLLQGNKTISLSQDVDNGLYQVDLWTMEPTRTRTFDVQLEGATVAQVQLNTQGEWQQQSFTTSVEDGTLDILLQRVRKAPAIAGISFSLLSDAPPDDNPSDPSDPPENPQTVLLQGTDEDDTLAGGADNERIIGGQGNDTLSGGTGQDTFAYNGPWYHDRTDVITDFEPGIDQIDFSGLINPSLHQSSTPFADYIQLNEVEGDTLVQFNPKGDNNPNFFRTMVVLDDVTDLSEADFILTSATGGDPDNGSGDPGGSDDPGDPDDTDPPGDGDPGDGGNPDDGGSDPDDPDLPEPGTPYAFGIMPENADIADARRAYEEWKSIYVSNSGVPDASNMLRVFTRPDGEGVTTSEYHGYGMLFAAHLEADDTVLQKLWNYAEQYLNSDGLMKWHIDGSGYAEWKQSALDGDVDIAMALDYAARRWPNRGWEERAEQYTNGMMVPGKNSYLRTDPIDETEWPRWKRGIYLNYQAVAYMDRFAERTGDERWVDITIPNTYELLEHSYENYELPAWHVDADGIPVRPNDPWNSSENRHDAGATRTNWRIGTHYLTTGHQDAEKWVDKLTDFFYEAGRMKGNYDTGDFQPTNLRTGYYFMTTGDKTAGNPYGDRKLVTETMMAGAGVAAMAAGNVEMTNEIYDHLASTPVDRDDKQMDNAMHVMELLIMSGGLEAVK